MITISPLSIKYGYSVYVFIRNKYSSGIVQLDRSRPDKPAIFSPNRSELPLKLLIKIKFTDPLTQLFHAPTQDINSAITPKYEILGGPESLPGLAIHTNTVAIVKDPARGNSSQHVSSPRKPLTLD